MLKCISDVLSCVHTARHRLRLSTHFNGHNDFMQKCLGPTPTLIPIGYCTPIINVDVGLGQCEYTIIKVFSRKVSVEFLFSLAIVFRIPSEIVSFMLQP